MLTIKKYNNNSFVVRPTNIEDLTLYKEELKKLGGVYDPNLFSDKTTKPGFIYRKKDRKTIEKYIETVNQKYIESKSNSLDKIINNKYELSYCFTTLIMVYSTIITTAFLGTVIKYYFIN